MRITATWTNQAWAVGSHCEEYVVDRGFLTKTISSASVVLMSLIVAACAPSDHKTYVKKDIEPTAIAKHVSVGDRIQIETENWHITLQVKGYESEKYLIGKDLFTGQDVKVAIDSIKEIRTKSPFASFGGPSVEEAGEAAIYTILVGPLLPLAAVTHPAWDTSEPPAKVDSSKNRFGIRVSMDEVREQLGEPLERYLCEGAYSMDGDEVWEYQKGVISDWLGGSKNVKFLRFTFPFEAPLQAHDGESLEYFQPCRPLPEKYR